MIAKTLSLLTKLSPLEVQLLRLPYVSTCYCNLLISLDEYSARHLIAICFIHTSIIHGQLCSVTLAKCVSMHIYLAFVQTVPPLFT